MASGHVHRATALKTQALDAAALTIRSNAMNPHPYTDPFVERPVRRVKSELTPQSAFKW
jgi:hypothetical protein